MPITTRYLSDDVPLQMRREVKAQPVNKAIQVELRFAKAIQVELRFACSHNRRARSTRHVHFMSEYSRDGSGWACGVTCRADTRVATSTSSSDPIESWGWEGGGREVSETETADA